MLFTGQFTFYHQGRNATADPSGDAVTAKTRDRHHATKGPAPLVISVIANMAQNHADKEA
jgi:hypothetical protein